MPYPVSYWPAKTPPGEKTLNLALYVDDGSVTGTPGVTTGIAFHAHRPVLLECIELFPGSIPGNGETSLNSAESPSNVYWNLLDTVAVLGGGADVAGQRANYTFNPVLPGSAGDGTGLGGGYYVVSHFVPLNASATQQMCGANLQKSGVSVNAGSRQLPSSGRDNTPFYLDLQPGTPGVTFNPSVVNWDHSPTTVNVPGAGTSTDAYSGETPRFLTFWACVTPSTWAAANTTPLQPSPVNSWTSTTVVTSALLNGETGIADVVNYLSCPPVFRAATTSGQDIPNTSNTMILLDTASTVDTFGGWSPNKRTYVVQRDGLYLVHGAVAWDSTPSDTAQRVTGIMINNQMYWGPGYPNAPVSIISASLPLTNVVSTKTQIFSLQAGDEIQLWCRQNSGGTVSLSNGDQSRMFAVWLGAAGAPITLWDPPDTAFRWRAGTSGADLPGVFQTHLANDLGFLVNRPYLLAWQSTSQAGFANNNWHTVRLDQVSGIVHGDAGDSYSGWTSGGSNLYTAVRDGWYLVVGELYGTYPSSTATCCLSAGLNVPTQGTWAPVRSPDVYQKIYPATNNFPPAATIVAACYLLAGETVQAQILGQDYGGSFGTQAGAVNGGQVNSHLEIIWLAE